MESLSVQATYGQALFEAAVDGGKVDLIAEEQKEISQIFKEYPELRKLFVIPTIPAEDKKAVARNIFEGKVAPELLNFLYILIDKRRLGAWDGAVRHYEELIDQRDGVTKGVLYSVVPVEDEKLKQFEADASAAVSKAVRLENRIDKSLIGGIVIYVDGKLIDVSIRNRLEGLKQIMLGS
ncbi:MAG: ATP synthase F1 subunit delta [Clostridiales Family XIII bacterium]|jgi:ATP synthase F1 delta subunit|nr:ATP synthase F1 subunit delta [Clostridiales Family XIII bacterium]